MLFLGNCREDAKKLEEWASAQSASGITDFTSRDGEVEATLKSIAERAGSKDKFHYSRFFAIGLFRLLECAKASDPAVLESVSVVFDDHILLSQYVLLSYSLPSSLDNWVGNLGYKFRNGMSEWQAPPAFLQRPIKPHNFYSQDFFICGFLIPDRRFCMN